MKLFKKFALIAAAVCAAATALTAFACGDGRR